VCDERGCSDALLLPGYRNPAHGLLHPGLSALPAGPSLRPFARRPAAPAPPPRSLRPWKHYVPLTPGAAVAGEVLGLVRRLQADDARAQQIAEAAQKWAYRCAARQGPVAIRPDF
jgi:hypothetical protein